MLQALAPVRHCGGSSEADRSNMVALLMIWVQGPTEGSLYFGRYSHSRSGDNVPGWRYLRMLPFFIIRGHRAQTQRAILNQRPTSSFRSGHLQPPTHSVPHICSPGPESAPTHPHRVSEPTAPPTPDSPGLILPSGDLVRQTSFRKQAQN